MKLKTLITEEEIQNRVKTLAKEISETFQQEPIYIISILKGAFIFTADLSRKLKEVEAVEFIKVKSYNGAKKGNTTIQTQPLNIEDKNVLIIDDIFDTGESLDAVIKEVKKHKPKKIKSCVLLDKKVKKNTDIYPDFIGFTIPNKFVVGYGLDYNEAFRQLPYVAYIETTEENTDGQD